VGNMPLSKPQWEVIEKSLAYPFGAVNLRCDGYEIAAHVQQSKMKLFVMVYVDGEFKGAWLDGKDDRCIKFCQKKIKHILNSSEKKKALEASRMRSLSKEDRAMFKEAAEKNFEYWVPYWTSPKAFCRHIRKTCKSIEIIE